jgi:hypothetical protein
MTLNINSKIQFIDVKILKIFSQHEVMGRIESDGDVSIMMTVAENTNFLMPAYNSRHNSVQSSRHNSRRGSGNDIKDLVTVSV